MSSVGGITNGNNNLQLFSESSKTNDGDELSDSPLVVGPAGREGVKVSLSGAGLKKSSSVAGRDSDIDESGLPQSVKQILKMIRKLQQQISEKLAELQAVMADKRLSPEEAKVRIGSLQSDLAMLNGGLLSANASLVKAMRQEGLTPEQVMKASALLMKS
ncbi:hypothetical protein [Pseudomonas sessilinigenes]|uniref:Chemotaxis protein n=1 Tax=Pseudomonas sessilinigenes TaxID=658629 RepID=A0ABX8MWJ5_9PSED|nr:hypothetical protein [Pseudomonas sessilinigenes]AZC23695.1 hypothetical protein C4K39_2011 [Pseudomonas sessilinigenes]QXH42688.1 hypothetical protein KSS89_10810 [Pseudomonas sessilinigenes]